MPAKKNKDQVTPTKVSAKKFIAPPVLIKWLIDTGCGHDLLSRKDMLALRAKPCRVSPLTFETAGGLVTTDIGASVWINEFEEDLRSHILHTDTPAVLSVGARCVEMGCSFIWLPRQNPYFVNPDGLIIRLEVHHNIPYLPPGCTRRSESGNFYVSV